MSKAFEYSPTSLDIGILCTSSDNYEHIRYPHCHPDYELSIALSGIHGVRLQNTRLHLKPGDLLLLRPNEIHARYLEEPGKHVTIAFPAQELNAAMKFLNDGVFDQLIAQDIPLTATLPHTALELITAQIQRIDLFCSLNKRRALSELRALLVMICTYYPKTSDGDMEEYAPWLSKLMLEMTKAQNMQRGIAAMLELVPYTHEYLCREFKRMLHCTPTNYINNIRLDYARKLLDDPNQSILDVCYTVGYNSISYFYNLFKARFGVAPNRYRKMRMVVYPDVPPEQSPQAQETPDL